MAVKKTAGKRSGLVVKPTKSKLIARSLTVLDMKIDRITDRLKSARPIDLNTGAACVIDIQCCIINCKDPLFDDGTDRINPGDMGEVDGFVFKVPSQVSNTDAPVYFLPKMGLKTAWKLSHESVKVPGGSLEGRAVGIAAEMFTRQALTKHGIAPTAPVIALVPKKSA